MANQKHLYKFERMFCKSLIVVTILLAVLLAYFHKKLTAPHEMPKFELDKWWGPYPIDVNQDTSIRPYKIEFSDAIVNDLKERLLHRRPLTPPLENSGFTYGFNTDFLTRVLDYWQNSYNFKDRERFLNKYDHYITNVQGLDIHYLHVKPKPPANVTVVPILLMHSWPGSIREFYEIIPLLTTYRSNKDFVFEVIAPSIPGFAFSQAPVRPGLGPIEVSVIFRNLMKRIGHERYYVQGGGYGHSIGSIMATLFPENILGFHSNMPLVWYNPVTTIYNLAEYLVYQIPLISLWPNSVVQPELEDRMYPLGEYMSEIVEESGYFHIQATKPDTVGIALSESPAGLAAYILEKFSTWTNVDYKDANDGGMLNKFSLTHLLDNVMIYWATNCMTPSMRHYAEGYKQIVIMDRIPTEVPTCGIKFKNKLLFHSDGALKRKYTNYLRSSVVEDGGHFPAMEMPDLLANDIYGAVDIFRDFHPKEKKGPQSKANYETAQTIYEFTVKDIKGREVKLEKYKGNVLIIVNVASECGYTNTHYNQLNKLHEKYSERGLRILAFPCNQFGGQEPGSHEVILQFTKSRNVKFDLFEKVEVNGDDAHPLWKFLKKSQGGTMGDFIKWNFSKFIVDKNGVPVERFGPNTNPLDLEPYLAQYGVS